MTNLPFRKRRIIAFTLLELLVVLAIIALLTTLVLPNAQSMIQRGLSLKCAGNLRVIGVALSQAVTDNNGQYPEIDQAAAPVYPPGSGATNLIGALGPYGVVTNTIQCPVDMRTTPSSFKQYGSSYEWNPLFDDDTTTTPILYLAPGVKIPVNSARVRLVTDFLPLHRGKMNALFGDGHVSAR
jgi:prepilin-type processing-associated H-X9-DG protein/prepilin-type N-terminal cleavage/methylation domain-containing protein